MPSNTNAEGLTAEAAVDRIEAAIHPRASDRRLHSRGAVYDAKFVPSGQIESRTIATHLRSETPAVVRFSNGGNFDADDRAKGVRGMAVKFLADGHAVADLAAADTLTFPARTPEGFVALVELLSMLQGGTLDKLKAVPKLVSVLVKHPEIGKALKKTALQNGLIMRVDPTWFAVAPALTAEESDLDEMCGLINKSLSDAVESVHAENGAVLAEHRK